MKQLTINITDNKYSFFLELLKSMDFISIVDNEDWYENLSQNEKNLIQKGIDDIENGQVHYHEDVMTLANKRISDLRNSK
jgi:hypothetical protein